MDGRRAGKDMEESIEQNLETVSNLVDTLVQFAIEYGFQILGALIVLIAGLKIGFAGKGLRPV